MKYQVLAMTPRNIDKEAKDECILDINNQKLKPTANLRIFRGNIDDLVRFTEHISDMCKKASRKSKTTQSNLMQDQASTVPNSNSSSPDVLPNCMSFL